MFTIGGRWSFLRNPESAEEDEASEGEECTMARRRSRGLLRRFKPIGAIDKDKIKCNAVDTASIGSTFIQCLRFISIWTLYSFHGNLYFLVFLLA